MHLYSEIVLEVNELENILTIPNSRSKGRLVGWTLVVEEQELVLS